MSQEKDHSQLEDHIIRRFEIQDYKGKGAYGIVWKAFDKKTKQTVALKKVFDAFQNSTDAQRTYREIVFLYQLTNHDNIIKLLSIIKADNNKDLYMVFEFMETDLHRVIRAKLLSPIHTQYVIYQLLKCLKYIHSGDLIHRDLKPANLLINAQCKIKVADFGLARTVSKEQNNFENPVMTEYVATRWYRAPEILMGSNIYSKAVDMWSAGCILAEMIIGKPLFSGTSTLNQIEKIVELLGKPSKEDIKKFSAPMAEQILDSILVVKRINFQQLFKGCNDKTIDFLKKTLIYDPTKRLTVQEALEHPFMEDFKNSEDEPILNQLIQIPMNDNKKLKMRDYREAIYRGQFTLEPRHVKQQSLSEIKKTDQMLSKVQTSVKSKSFYFTQNETTDDQQIPTVHKTKIYKNNDSVSKQNSFINNHSSTMETKHYMIPQRVKTNTFMVQKPKLSKTPENSSYAGVNTPYRSRSTDKSSFIIQRSNSKHKNQSQSPYDKKSNLNYVQQILQKVANAQMVKNNGIYITQKPQLKANIKGTKQQSYFNYFQKQKSKK